MHKRQDTLTFSSMNKKNRKLILLFPLGLALVSLSGCLKPLPKAPSKTPVAKSEHINKETKFSQKEYGVASSPRVTTEKRTRKGGGRFQIGKPYKIRGKWYTPKDDPTLNQVGLASWYGPNFHGRLTANGEIYDQYGISAAHPTLPLPSYAMVTNLENGRKIKVRVNDRGPYAHGRVIDLSAKAAKLLGYEKQGVVKVKVEYAGLAAMDGLDEEMLLASYQGPGFNDFNGNNAAGSGTMIAMNEQVIPTGPVAAIDQSFAPTVASLSGGVPVPIGRPTLFEGIPLAQNQNDGSLINDVERVVYRPTTSSVVGKAPRPMAYWDDSNDTNSLEYKFTQQEEDVARPFGSTAIQIELGRFADVSSLSILEKLFAEAGKISFANSSQRAILDTQERHANQILIYARSIGLLDAKIR